MKSIFLAKIEEIDQKLLNKLKNLLKTSKMLQKNFVKDGNALKSKSFANV